MITRPLSALLLFALSNVAWAADGPAVIAKAVETIPVIVQFRDAPVFARTPSTRSLQSFDERFATFERDLAKIDRPHVSANDTEPAPRIEQRFSRVFAGAAVTVSGDALEQIRKLDYVRAIYLDRPVKKYLEHSVPKIRAPEVWTSFGTRGANVVVAIIDTGIDYTHPAFGNGFGTGHRVTGGYDFIHNDTDPMDDDGHGTHVAGIVGGNGGGITGVAPDVTFLAYKVLNENGAGRESTVLAGIERAADPNDDGNPADHADVANLSLGESGTPDDPLSQAVDTATAAGVIFCIAAGNDGEFHTIGTPGNAPSAITVGATTIDDALATFSSKGPVATSLAIKPEVLAPGVDIVSARMGGGVVAYSGTSMATPHVAGVAALLRAIHPDWSAAHIKAAIVGTAEILGGDVMEEGGGRVDALRAATADVIAAQSVLSLGNDDATLAHWTTSATLTLVNHGSAARTLALQAASPRAGIGITLDATSFVLAPGESRDVHVAFDIDNSQVPAPLEGSLAYAGAIQIGGGAEPLHVPWAFVKGASVTLDYDGNESFEAFFSATTTDVLRQVEAGPSQHRITALLPLGTYDVTFFPIPILFTDGRQRVMVLEQQPVDRTKTLSVRRAMATLEIKPTAVDEKGARLESNRDCEQILAVMGPDHGAAGTMIARSTGGYLVSAMSGRFALLPFERCVDFVHHSAYSAQFAPLHGIASSQAPSIVASDWSRTPLRVAMPPNANNPGVTLFTGWVWHEPNRTASDFIGRRETVKGSWEGTLFLTKEQHPLMTASGKILVDGTPEIAPPIAPRIPLLDSPKLHRTDDGIVAWHYLTNAPNTYVVQPDETLVLGEGLIRIELSASILHSFTTAFLRYKGALDEDLLTAGNGTSLVVRDHAGAAVASGEGFSRTLFLDPGRYDVDVTKPVTLRGIAGEAAMHARFDTRLPDAGPPTLTSLRVEDAHGNNTSFLLGGEPGTLLFSAIDAIPNQEDSTSLRAAIRTDATSVKWRAHGATEWTALAASILSTEVANTAEEVAAVGHPPVGTSYRADLSPLSHSGAKAIDLTLHFEDASGNSYDWTISPAITIEDAARRRPSGR